MSGVVGDVVGAITNPIGTVASAIGLPDPVGAALNPVGGLTQGLITGTGPVAGTMKGMGVGLPSIAGIGSAMDPSNINHFRATAPVNNWTPTPLNDAFNATAPTIGYQAPGWSTNLWGQQAGLSESDYANAIRNAQSYQQQVRPWIHAEQDRASDSANALTGASNANVTGGTIGQEQGLANMLRAQALGQGPSLAQLQFQRDLNQSQAAASSAIGSIKGINPAMASRLVAQQTAASNQDAVTRAAMQRAQEQFAAEQGLGSILGTMGGQQLGQQANQLQGLTSAGQLHLGAGNLALGQYGAATQAMGTAGGLQNQQNSNRISNLAQQQQINAELSGQNASAAMQAQGINAQVAQANAANNLAAQQMNLQNTLGYQNYQLGMQGLEGQTAAQNAAFQSHAQDVNAATAAQNASNLTSLIGGGLGGAGSSLGLLGTVGKLLNQGGEVPGYASGGGVAPELFDIERWARAIPSRLPEYPVNGGLAKVFAGLPGNTPDSASSEFPNSPLVDSLPFGSPYASPWPGASPLLGGDGFDVGGRVAGRAQVRGDSPQNDTVPARLSPGEVVIPRSIAQAPDAPRRAAEFVAMIQAKHGEPGQLPTAGFGRVLAHRRALREKLAALGVDES